MVVSIVIPAFNEEKLLPRTLLAVERAIGAFRDRGWGAEVIVCDNNSTDATAAVAAAHGARVVFEPFNQIGRARNTGAAAATGDWILFLDADCDPSRELFEEAARRIERGRDLFVGAVVQLDAELPWTTSVLLAGWNLLSRTLRWMAGSFVLVEAAAFREVGGFNLDLFASEEVDLSRRLKALARRKGRSTSIITRPGLRTSARRLQWYSARELVGFFLRAAWRPRATPRSREACAMWYDGRR